MLCIITHYNILESIFSSRTQKDNQKEHGVSVQIQYGMETSIINNFHVSRKHFPHYDLWPFLKSFRKNCMIGVRNCPVPQRNNFITSLGVGCM
jgi:hypothetical protein